MPLRFNDLRRARSLTASSAEKAVVRDRLQAFTEANPVREVKSIRHIQQRSNLFRPALAFAAILLLAGAGTASAAERALPDNTSLYFVKTNINEPVKRLLALTPEAKASVEAELVMRRLEETEVLAATGRLSPSIQTQAEARFIRQVEKAQEKINQLDDKGKQQEAQMLSVRLEQKLQIHEKKLEKLDAESRSDVALTPMLKRLRGKTEALVHEREQKEEQHRSKEGERHIEKDQRQELKVNNQDEKRQKPKVRQERADAPIPTPTPPILRSWTDARLRQHLDMSSEGFESSATVTTTRRTFLERLRARWQR